MPWPQPKTSPCTRSLDSLLVNMHKQGLIVRWNAARAFGFIRSPDTATDVFFHLRDFRGVQPPQDGMAVAYEEIHMGGKGPRAMAVQPTAAAHTTRVHPAATGFTPARTKRSAAPPQSTKPAHSMRRSAHQPSPRSQPPGRSRTAGNSNAAVLTSFAPFLILAWGALLAWGLWNTRLPWWVLGAAFALNIFTFMAYAIDKSAAQSGQWRTQESHLHLLALAGGWPGAWCAQQWLRHKSRKATFLAAFWGTVMVHCVALLTWVAGWLQ